MANPNLENGHYLQLSHEILERLIHCSVSGRELKAVLYVIRMTYGFKRKEAEISSLELSEALGIDQRDSRKVMVSLCEKRIIVKTSSHKGVRPPQYSLEKDWEKWDFGGRKTLPELVASRGKYTPTRQTEEGVKHPDKGGQNTPTNGGKIPRLMGVKHPDYVSKDTEQIEPATRGIKKKEERKKNPPTPRGGEGGVEVSDFRLRIREAMVRNGWTPSRKELTKATDLVASPTPAGWDKTAWRRHVFGLLIELCNAIKAEHLAGKPVWAPIAVACERLRNQVMIDQMLPQPRKEAI